MIERFRKCAYLGRGATAEVWRAYDYQRHGMVALKQFYSQEKQDQEAMKREYTILSNLDHNAIPKVWEQALYEERCSLVMELVSGASLAARIHHHELPQEKELLQWAIQLLDVLRYLHHHQILYLDIKPEHLLLDRYGNLHLVDFGIACERWAAHPIRYGTIGFCMLNQVEQLDERCDLYAFGKTMLALHMGIADGRALLHIRSEDANVSHAFKQILKRCLQESEVTYSSTDAVLSDVLELMEAHKRCGHIWERRNRYHIAPEEI